MIIIEIQHSNDGSTSTICTTHTNTAEAEQKYHQVLAAAAVSKVDVHGATMLNDDGSYVQHKAYYHGTLEAE